MKLAENWKKQILRLVFFILFSFVLTGFGIYNQNVVKAETTEEQITEDEELQDDNEDKNENEEEQEVTIPIKVKPSYLQCTNVKNGIKIALTNSNESGVSVKYEIYRQEENEDDWKLVKTIVASKDNNKTIYWTDKSVKKKYGKLYYYGVVTSIGDTKTSMTTGLANSMLRLKAPKLSKLKKSNSGRYKMTTLTAKWSKAKTSKGIVTEYKIFYCDNKDFNTRLKYYQLPTGRSPYKFTCTNGKTIYCKVNATVAYKGKTYTTGWSNVQKVKI